MLLQGLQTQAQNLAAAEKDATAVRERFNLLRGRASAFNEFKLLLDQRPPESNATR